MPDRLALAQCGKEGSRPLPTNNREVSGHRGKRLFPVGCRGRIVASRAVYPLGCIIGAAATGGIVAVPTGYYDSSVRIHDWRITGTGTASGSSRFLFFD